MNVATVPQDLAIDLRQLVMTIANAVDLVGVDDLLHGRRVGLLARDLGRQLGLDEKAQILLYDAGLLHDCGVASSCAHPRLLRDLEWPGAEAHCIRGGELLRDFAPLASLAPIIRHHHSRWDAPESQSLPPDVARFANVIFLADRIDALLGPFHGDLTTLAHAEEIRMRLAAARGSLFAPDLVDAFLELSQGDRFWLGLQPDAVRQYQTEMEAFRDLWLVTWQEFRRCTEIFARILDAKSPHTERHSRGVSLLAGHLAGRMGMDVVTCERIAVAGLLHDIGKLKIPGAIIDADGALAAAEFELMKTHSRGTLEVLQRLQAIEEIARWASYHHETPDGEGYPFHVAGDALPLEARIINVADVFQALAQDRPYHRPLEAAEILAILKERAASGKSDASVVAAVEADLDNCHRIALCRLSQ